MRKFTMIILILLSVTVNAQFKTGVTAYYGRSVLWNDLKPARDGESYVTKYDDNFIGGIYFEYEFIDRLSLKANVLYDIINTFEAFYIVSEEEGTFIPLPAGETGPLSWWEDEYWIKMEYLSFPLTVSFNYKKWSLYCGGQYSYLLRIGAASHHLSYALNKNYTTDFKYADGFYTVIRPNCSLVAGCSFSLFENLIVEFRYLNGLTNIVAEPFEHTTKTRQFLLGISYQIYPWKQEKSKLFESPEPDEQ